jgi:hypothetical protein
MAAAVAIENIKIHIVEASMIQPPAPNLSASSRTRTPAAGVGSRDAADENKRHGCSSSEHIPLSI